MKSLGQRCTAELGSCSPQCGKYFLKEPDRNKSLSLLTFSHVNTLTRSLIDGYYRVRKKRSEFTESRGRSRSSRARPAAGEGGEPVRWRAAQDVFHIQVWLSSLSLSWQNTGPLHSMFHCEVNTEGDRIKTSSARRLVHKLHAHCVVLFCHRARNGKWRQPGTIWD